MHDSALTEIWPGSPYAYAHDYEPSRKFCSPPIVSFTVATSRLKVVEYAILGSRAGNRSIVVSSTVEILCVCGKDEIYLSQSIIPCLLALISARVLCCWKESPSLGVSRGWSDRRRESVRRLKKLHESLSSFSRRTMDTGNFELARSPGCRLSIDLGGH